MSMNANDPNTVPITVGANDGSTLIIAAAAAAAADSMRLKPHDPDELVPDADEVVKPYVQIQFVVVPAVWPKMSIDAMAQQKKVEETVAAVAVHLFSDGDGEILPDWLESVPFGMASVRAYVVKGKRREDRDSFDGVMVVDVVEDHLDRWCSSFDEESGFIRIVAPHELRSSPEIVTPIFWLQAPGQGLAAAVVAITKAVREAHEGDEAAAWFPAVIRDDPRHPDQVGIMMSMLNATFLALYKEPVAVPTKAGIIQVRPVLPAGAIAEGKESFIVYGVTGFGTQRALEQMVARKTGVDPGEIECYSMGGGTQRGVMLCNYPFTDIAFSAILALTDPATGPIACPVPGVEQRSVTFWCALNMPELEQKASRILMRDASTVRAGNTKEALENKMQEAIQRALTNNQAPELSAGGGAGARLPRRWRPWAAGLMAAALALLGAAAARPTAHPQAAHPPAPVSWQREGSVHDGGRPAPADTRTGEVSGEVGGVCVWFANSGDWHDCVIRPGLVPAGGERPRPPWRRSEPSLRTCQRDGGGGGRNVGGSVALAETSAGGAAAVCATGKAALLGCCSPRGYPTGADGRGGGWDCGAGDGVMAEPDDRAAPESQNALLGGIDEEVRPRPQPQGLQCAGADVAGAGRRGRLRDRGEMELSKTPRESMNDRVDGGGRRWQANVVVAKSWRRQITEERDDELVDVTLLDLQTRDRGSVRIVPTHIDGMMVDDVAPVVLAAAKAKRPLAKRSFRGVVTRHRRPKSMQGPAVCIMGGECSVWPAAGLKAGACEKCGRAPQWGGAAAVDRGTASRTGGAKTAASESGTRDAGGGGAGLHAPERPAVIAPPMGPQPSADGSGARHSVGGALGTLPPGVVGAPEAVPGGPGALRGGLGGGLVGRRLLIQWRGDPGCPWFAGVVDRRARVEGRWSLLHRVAYDDGDVKWHDIGAEERAGQLHWEETLQAGQADFPAFGGGCVSRRPERGRTLTPVERGQSKEYSSDSDGDGPTYHEATGTWTSGTAGGGEEGPGWSPASSTVEYSPAPSTVGEEEEEDGSAGAEAIRQMIEEAYFPVRPARWMVPPGWCGVRVTRRMRSFMGDAATLPHSVPVFSHYGFRCGSRPRWNGRLEYCALAPPHRLNFGPGYVDGEYRVGYHSIAWYRRQFNEQLTVESVVNSDDGGNSEDDGEAAPSYQVPDVRPDPRLRFSDWQARSTMLRADFTAVAELDFETGQWQLLSQYDFHTRLLTRESGELGASRDEASYLGGDYGWHLTRHSCPQPRHEGERMFRYVEPYHEADELPPLGDHTRRFGAAALRMLCLGNLGMPHRQSWEEGPDCYSLLSLHLEDSVLPVEVEELFSQGDLVRTLPWPRRDAQRLEADDRGRREAAGWLVPEAGRLHRIVEGRGVHLATVRVVVCGTAYHVPADFGYMERVHDSQEERPGAQGPDQYSPSSGELPYEAVLRLEVSRFDVAIDRLQDAAWRSRMHARRCRKEADRREAAMTEMIVWLALRVIEEGLVRAGRGVVRVPTLVELAEAASRQANVLPTLLLGRDLSQAGFSKRDPVSHVQDGHMERYGGRGYGHVRHRKCEASRVVIPGGAPRLGKPCSHYQHCEGTPIARPGWIAEYDEPMFDCQGGYNPWGNAPDPRYCYDTRQARKEHLDVRRAYHSLAVLHVWQQTDGRSVRVTPAARAMDKGVDSRATPDDDESLRLFVDEAAAAAAREPPGEWTEEQLAMAAEQLEEDGLLHHAGARHCLGEVDDEDWDM